MIWRCRDRTFDLSARTLVMGVVNVTPDSFSDGGRFLEPGAAFAHARALVSEGADVVDLGAESTRPGAGPVPPAEQWRRLEPVLSALAAAGDACLSVDTTSAEVADRALAAGAHVINDVSALRDTAMAGVIAARGAGVVLMHLPGTPSTMQRDPRYEDAVREIAAYLGERRAHAVRSGIAPECIVLDPGIGFGKTLEHNLELLARLGEFAALGRPVLVGASRKSFLGRIFDLPAEQRLEAGIAAHAIAVFEGAAVVRTHDVGATVRAVRVARALAGAKRS